MAVQLEMKQAACDQQSCSGWSATIGHGMSVSWKCCTSLVSCFSQIYLYWFSCPRSPQEACVVLKISRHDAKENYVQSLFWIRKESSRPQTMFWQVIVQDLYLHHKLYECLILNLCGNIINQKWISHYKFRKTVYVVVWCQAKNPDSCIQTPAPAFRDTSIASPTGSHHLP